MYVRTCNVCFYLAIFFIVIYFIMVFTWLLLCELFLIVEVALLTVTMSKTNFPLGIIKYLSVCLCNRVTKTGWTSLWTVMMSFSQMFVVLLWLVTVKQLIKDQEGNCNLVINTFIYHLKLNQFPWGDRQVQTWTHLEKSWHSSWLNLLFLCNFLFQYWEGHSY